MDEPELWPELGHVWIAFTALHTSRPVGMTVGAIPGHEIVTWLDIQGYTDALVRREIYSLIKAMDAAYLRFQTEKSQDERDSKPSPNEVSTEDRHSM